MANKTTVGDYVSLVRGVTYKGNLVGKPGPALLGLGSIQPGGGFRDGDYKTYGGECPPKLMLYPGDLFASLKGATKDGKMIGSVARVPPSVPSGRITQDTVKLDFPEPDREISNFIYWMLRTPHYRNYCAGRAMGSAVVALSRDDFLSYPVPAATPGRRRLVKLLEALDEKIALNRQISETIETSAQTLFKFSFLDVAETKLPKGWEVRGLDQIASFLNGLALQKFPPNGDASLPVIKIAQLRAGHTENADRAGTNLPPQYIIEDGDVLFSWSGSLEVEIWCGGRGALNQHLFKVTSANFPKWFYYLWTRHHLSFFQNTAADKATTMGHIQRHHLHEAKVFVPPSGLMETMNKQFAPLLDKLIASRLESRTLAELRDALLPKLLSGELRVPVK
jgi:type I restriction enzyme S subunit